MFKLRVSRTVFNTETREPFYIYLKNNLFLAGNSKIISSILNKRQSSLKITAQS